METIRELEKAVADRDRQLVALRAKVEALEKREVLSDRRAGDLQRKQTAAEADIKALKKKRVEEIQGLELDVKRARSDAVAAAARAAEAEERVAREKAAHKRERDEHAAEERREKEKALNDQEESSRVHMLQLEAKIVELKELLNEARKQFAAPKAHTEEEFEELSSGGRRSARSRDMEYAIKFFSQRSWRVADWATVLKRQAWLEELWESKELWELKMEWARELFGMLMGQHWGVALGLYLTLTEHMPTRQIRRIGQVPEVPCFRVRAARMPSIPIARHIWRLSENCTCFDVQASSKVYQPSTNSYIRRVLLCNPHRATDVLLVPSIFPPLCKFMPEIHILTAEHGLSLSDTGRIAFQNLHDVAADIARETSRLLGLPLSAFDSAKP
eukprot:6209436-Pleurochrysis_carterae.AAC.1